MRLTLRQLSYFVAVVDAGSMTRAVERLNVAKSSLSVQIKELETTLGTSLLVRHSHGVSATERGAALYDRASETLDYVAETERIFTSSGAQPPISLRVGVIPAVSRMVGVEAITHISGNLRGTTLFLSEGWASEMIPDLVSQALDFVIAYDLSPQGEFEVVNFYNDEFVFACAPGLLPKGSKVELAAAIASDLTFYGNSSLGQGSVSLRAAVDAAEARGLRFSGGREVQSIDVWRNLIARGLATSIVPFATIRNEAQRGDISVHRIEGAPIVRTLGLAALPGTLELGREIGFVDFISGLLEDSHSAFEVGTPWEKNQSDGQAKRIARER